MLKKLIEFLTRAIKRNKEAPMQIHIVLDETPTPGQLTKALQVMLMLSGVSVMGQAVKALHELFDEEDDAPATTQGAGVSLHIPPVPAAAPPPPAAAVASTERDSTGLPWDARIHSSKKTANKDGTWKARKNIEAGTVAAVEAELRALPGVAAAPPPPAAIVAPAAAPPPPATMAAPPVVAGATVPANDFVGIMQKISEGIRGGKLTQEVVSAALVSVGLKQPLDLNTNPQQIPAVAAYLDAVMM